VTSTSTTSSSTTSTPAGHSDRPLRADAERNRRRILVAAREVFAQRGLEAGLDEIAKHAGVGTGTVYRRFPDKARLIETLFEERFEQVVACAQEAAEWPDPWEGFTRAVETLAAMQIEDRGLKDLFFSHFGDAEAFRGHHERLLPLLESLLRRAQEHGVLRRDVVLTDLGMVQLVLTQIAAFTDDVEPGLWRRYLALQLDGLRADRTGPSPLPHRPLSIDEFDAACGRGRTAR
jgi:AcrR family transcriptional regulator